MARTRNIPVSEIRMDDGTQMRESIHDSVVLEYAAVYAEKGAAGLPPLVVVHDGATIRLVDGFHRLHALRRTGIPSVRCVVHEGDRAAARWMACSMNAAHGIQRSNADKRLAVKAAIAIKPGLPDHAIAAHCSVSANLVASVRGESAARQDPVPAAAQRDAEDGPEQEDATHDDGDGEACPEPAPAPTPARSMEDDALGNAVPQAIEEDFVSTRRWADSWLSRWRSLARELDEYVSSKPAGKGTPQEEHKAVSAALRTLVADHLRPHFVCPRCSGAGSGCRACFRRGWLPKAALAAFPAPRPAAPPPDVEF